MFLITLSEKEILDIVEPIMDSCLEGSNEDDHEKHTKYFTDRMKNIVTPENLKIQLSQKFAGVSMVEIHSIVLKL